MTSPGERVALITQSVNYWAKRIAAANERKNVNADDLRQAALFCVPTHMTWHVIEEMGGNCVFVVASVDERTLSVTWEEC
jgi:hypothetical protein